MRKFVMVTYGPMDMPPQARMFDNTYYTEWKTACDTAAYAFQDGYDVALHRTSDPREDGPDDPFAGDHWEEVEDIKHTDPWTWGPVLGCWLLNEQDKAAIVARREML